MSKTLVADKNNNNHVPHATRVEMVWVGTGFQESAHNVEAAALAGGIQRRGTVCLDRISVGTSRQQQAWLRMEASTTTKLKRSEGVEVERAPAQAEQIPSP